MLLMEWMPSFTDYVTAFHQVFLKTCWFSFTALGEERQLGFQAQLYSKSPFCNRKSTIWSPEIKFWLRYKKTGQTSKQTKCNKHKKSYYTYASIDSVTEPIWFTFSKRQLQAFFSTAILMLQSRNKISTLNILQIWINAKIAVINLLTLHIWYSPLAATHFVVN